jgi:hypothetical protein
MLLWEVMMARALTPEDLDHSETWIEKSIRGWRTMRYAMPYFNKPAEKAADAPAASLPPED